MVILGLSMLLAALLVADVLSKDMELPWTVHFVDLLIMCLLLWIWFDTQYVIEREELVCRSGPFRVAVPIMAIRSLHLGEQLWVGYKLSLSMKGMVVRYNKYDEIYISPRDAEGLASVLRRMNPSIEVRGHVR